MSCESITLSTNDHSMIGHPQWKKLGWYLVGSFRKTCTFSLYSTTCEAHILRYSLTSHSWETQCLQQCHPRQQDPPKPTIASFERHSWLDHRHAIIIICIVFLIVTSTVYIVIICTVIRVLLMLSLLFFLLLFSSYYYYDYQPITCLSHHCIQYTLGVAHYW